MLKNMKEARKEFRKSSKKQGHFFRAKLVLRRGEELLDPRKDVDKYNH